MILPRLLEKMKKNHPKPETFAWRSCSFYYLAVLLLCGKSLAFTTEHSTTTETSTTTSEPVTTTEPPTFALNSSGGCEKHYNETNTDALISFSTLSTLEIVLLVMLIILIILLCCVTLFTILIWLHWYLPTKEKKNPESHSFRLSRSTKIKKSPESHSFRRSRSTKIKKRPESDLRAIYQPATSELIIVEPNT